MQQIFVAKRVMAAGIQAFARLVKDFASLPFANG
jgi:hypothetical protein